MNETKKVDMSNWNAFIKRVLAERQQGKENGATSANNLTFKKESEKSQKKGGKNEQ